MADAACYRLNHLSFEACLTLFRLLEQPLRNNTWGLCSKFAVFGNRCGDTHYYMGPTYRPSKSSSLCEFSRYCSESLGDVCSKHDPASSHVNLLVQKSMRSKYTMFFTPESCDREYVDLCGRRAFSLKGMTDLHKLRGPCAVRVSLW